MLYYNAHIRAYRRNIKLQFLAEKTPLQNTNPRTVADILEDAVQQFAFINGCRPNQVLATCEIEDIGTINHRGGDCVILR